MSSASSAFCGRGRRRACRHCRARRSVTLTPLPSSSLRAASAASPSPPTWCMSRESREALRALPPSLSAAGDRVTRAAMAIDARTVSAGAVDVRQDHVAPELGVSSRKPRLAPKPAFANAASQAAEGIMRGGDRALLVLRLLDVALHRDGTLAATELLDQLLELVARSSGQHQGASRRGRRAQRSRRRCRTTHP